jgi:murein L,D-transpeptidase YafK
VRYQFTLRSRLLLRALLASAAIAAVMSLAGCGGAPVASNGHMQPLSERMLAELKAKKMEKESPILMRIFKEEAELEVWKQDDSGRYLC